MEAVLIAYGIADKDGKKLRTLCTQKSVRLRRVLPEEYALRVGAFCGAAERSAEPDGATGADEPDGGLRMLVFAGFSQARLENFLSALKTQRLCTDLCKATLTETNANWSGRTLYQELAREKAAMNKI